MRKDPKGNPLPPRMYHQHSRYWYVYRNKWQALSSHYPEAMARYGRLVSPSSGMSELIDSALDAHAKMPTGRGKVPTPGTMKTYRKVAERLKGIFAEFAPNEIKAVHVQQMYDHELALHHGTANACLSVLRIVLRYGLKWGKVDHNPAVSVRALKAPERKRFIEDWEYKAIQKHASPWLGVLMDVLFLTGQRIGDALQIQVSHCTEDGIKFIQQKTDTWLTVEWTPELRDAVDRARRLHGNVLSPFLFRPKGSGKPYTYAAALSAWQRACELAGVKDATIHDLRARSLTIARRQGLDAVALAGHSDAKQTERYIRRHESVLVQGPRAVKEKQA